VLRKRNHSFTSVYLQMDELWSYLWRKKTKVWIWTGIDAATRMFIVFHIGDRSGDSAKALVGTIKARIHGVPGLITTDGLEAYVERYCTMHQFTQYVLFIRDRVRASRRVPRQFLCHSWIIFAMRTLVSCRTILKLYVSFPILLYKNVR
jgi:IS1 family transposase